MNAKVPKITDDVNTLSSKQKRTNSFIFCEEASSSSGSTDDDDDFFHFDVEDANGVPAIESIQENKCNQETLLDTPPKTSMKKCMSQSILRNSSNNLNLIGSSSSKKMTRNKLSFSTLEIREYKITVGDNPSVSRGPPISLDWKYDEKKTLVVPLEDYEDNRGMRRCKSEMAMPDRYRRSRLLEEHDISIKQVVKATKNAAKARKQRIETYNGRDVKDQACSVKGKCCIM